MCSSYNSSDKSMPALKDNPLFIFMANCTVSREVLKPGAGAGVSCEICRN